MRKPSTQLNTVILHGNFRHKPALVRFTRRGDGWLLTINVGGKHVCKSLSGHWKPCWTVAMQFMEELWPAKSRAPRRVEEGPNEDLIPFRSA